MKEKKEYFYSMIKSSFNNNERRKVKFHLFLIKKKSFVFRKLVLFIQCKQIVNVNLMFHQ
jgi:hypothetical protein